MQGHGFLKKLLLWAKIDYPVKMDFMKFSLYSVYEKEATILLRNDG